jgi:surface antigen
MLKVAFDLGVRQAFLDAGITKESMPMWLKRTLMGTGVGAGLGAGTSALMGNDAGDIGVGAGIGALGGGLTGASISALKRIEINKLLEAKRAAMEELKREFQGAFG